jgi:misacylated tRNA(Ala) deacylase
MTEELFREDATLDACDAIVTHIDERGVQLDRTVFYPQGGGQAGDRGTLHLPGLGVLQIADTRKGLQLSPGRSQDSCRPPGGQERSDVGANKAPQEIVHVPAPGQEALLASLAPGHAVTAHIDRERRARHMRFHTATHLLCALVPFSVDGCSITADYARLDFHMTDALDKLALSEGIARLVDAAHPVRARWISEAELDANPQLVRSMSVQPPRGLGRVRLIEIDGVDLQPCGGTHVSNTAEIGRMRVTKVEKKSAMTRRVILGIAESAEGRS